MIQVGVLIPQHYKLLSIAAILDVLETANRLSVEVGKPSPFELRLLHAGGSEYNLADHFFSYPLQAIQDEWVPDLIMVPSFSATDIGEAIRLNRAYIPWLIKQYQNGAEIASICTGAFLFAASGLLDGKIATTHVDACKKFSAAFPAVILEPDKTVTEDGRLFTSGGATSSFHLLLHLVHRHCGKELAVKLAKVFAIDMDRHRQSYFSTFHPSRDHNDDLVATAQEKIEANFHDTGTIEEMIKDIPSSRRNIVRRFKQVTGITPIEYLQHTRVEAAKKLLLQTGKQMNEVIMHSGYNDHKAFRKIFRKTVGMTPSEYREKFQVR